MKVTLLIPTLNEITCIKEILPAINKDWVDQIIILDGGSNDGTIEWSRQHGYFVYVQKECGIRRGYAEVMEFIKGDIVITFSPDGNSKVDYIPPLIDKMREGYDMVIVSRYKADAKSLDDSRMTAFGNWLFTSLINLFFRARYTDALVMFRAWRKQVIYELEINKRNNFPFWEDVIGALVSWESLLSIRCAKRKLRYTEIPGDEPKRIGGKRKLRPFVTGSAVLFQIMQEIFFRR